MIMTRGGRICFFSNLRSSRLAACLLRWRWTRTSSTTPPGPRLAKANAVPRQFFEYDIVQIPFVANPRKAATDPAGKLLAELARPLSDGFVADDDAAGRQ